MNFPSFEELLLVKSIVDFESTFLRPKASMLTEHQFFRNYMRGAPKRFNAKKILVMA